MQPPPRAPADDGCAPGAICDSPAVLRKRADFLRAAQAGRAGTAAFLLQARERSEGEADGMRIGFTCSRKVGNAVARNRAKRRLRAIARAVLPDSGRPGWDYVLVGKAGATASHPFDAMLTDLRAALDRVHRARGRNMPGRPETRTPDRDPHASAPEAHVAPAARSGRPGAPE